MNQTTTSRDVLGADTSEILARIDALQFIQKRNRPTSAEWIEASNELKPLFEEMARREPR